MAEKETNKTAVKKTVATKPVAKKVTGTKNSTVKSTTQPKKSSVAKTVTKQSGVKKVTKTVKGTTPKKVKAVAVQTQPVQTNGVTAQQPQFVNPQAQGQPLYYDPATGQPVYSTPNPAGAGMLNMAMYNAYAGADVQKMREENKKKSQKVYGTTALILALCGAGVFALGYLLWFFAFSAGSIDPSMFILVILGWLSGPLLMLIIPPILWFIGLIFGIVGVFKGPKRVISWIGFAISILVAIAGIYLVAMLGSSVIA